ncbi:hypothetical protein F5888DRAFT_1602878 [Russula emetica]|nr:hypothetical protein F5888DRAFT_1602878 [Russula emetica]
MASSEALPTNGHVHHPDGADNAQLCDVEHEDTTGTNPVEPKQVRSAQSEAEPLLSDDHPASQSAPDKHKPSTSPAKRPLPVNTTTKGASGPPTPQVKKILNSGKFGTGVTKAVPPPTTSSISAKHSATPQTSSTPKPAPPSNPIAVKKSISAPSSKAIMPPKPSTTTPSAPPPTRRTSLVPAKPTGPPVRSSTLSASTSGKPLSSAVSSAPAKPAVPQRASVVSPDSTASARSATIQRPRASVSEAVIPKKAAAPRSSLAPSAKPPATSTARPARTPGAGSISSLKGAKEPKEGGADLAVMQTKLDEATASLVLKTGTISELETQVGELKASLNNITADLEAARQNFENAKLAKASADKELAEARDALVASQGDRHKSEQVSDELEAARATITEQNAFIGALGEQIKALEAEVDESLKFLESLRADHVNDADIVAAAERDRQSLVEARAELETMETKTTALKAAQAEALDAATAKISSLELQASRAEALATEIADLRAGKEGTSNKLSELEVEILEIKEARDLAEEERTNSKAQINTLREEVATATAAAEKTVEEAAAKQSAATEHLEEVKKQHEAALALVVEESKKLTDQLHASQAEINRLRNNLEALDAAATSAAEEHAGRLAEAEQAHKARQDELKAEIERISVELAAQEAVYDAKVQGVKDEHEQRLQQAFERAKNEAGDSHTQDLQVLRENSEGATEQLRSSHQATVESLKTDHEAALASQAQFFQKQLSSQALELKATAEDLAKAKTTLSTSLQEMETLKAQLDETRQGALVAASTAVADHDAEIERLTKELSNVREELDGLNEVFRATQESMQAMGNNHQKELEEAAKGRAEEVSKIRAAHDTEIQSLVTDKADLVTRLSDLEGDLLSLRASTASTGTAASPKRNGSAAAPAETVTKDELLRMHEAHDLKMNDLHAEHVKEIRALQEQLNATRMRASEVEQDLDRKKMEILYLEQDQEESQDQITKYVKLFGFKSFLGSLFALAVIISSGIF